jgi:hypothetical protein
VIGGVIANLLGTGDIFELNVLGFIVAVIAAVLLVVAETSQARATAARADQTSSLNDPGAAGPRAGPAAPSCLSPVRPRWSPAGGTAGAARRPA